MYQSILGQQMQSWPDLRYLRGCTGAVSVGEIKMLLFPVPPFEIPSYWGLILEGLVF